MELVINEAVKENIMNKVFHRGYLVHVCRLSMHSCLAQRAMLMRNKKLSCDSRSYRMQ